VFDVQSDELNNAEGGCGLIQTLLQESNEQEDFAMREPLLLNGHSGSPVRTLAFDSKNGSRLASGSSDGSVVLWDIVAESGLFRLLGHRGGITNIHFVSLQKEAQDLLITTSLDGYVKVWDLKGQCCIQTIPTHKGEVWGGACTTIPASPQTSSADEDGDERVRLVTGSSDGQARVWSVQPPKRYSKKSIAQEGEGEVAAVSEDDKSSDDDDVCHYMGTLTAPPNVSTSSERISCMHFHPNGKHVGVLHANSKNVDVYLIRSVQESVRKKQRRLRRRKEKSKISSTSQESSTKGPKRGMLDDPQSEEEQGENPGDATPEQSLDPEKIKASDEFEYYGTVRASHKVKGFIFVPFKESGSGLRIVCSLATNALEVHSLSRKKER
jgi:U3 small nucleolar RNA-associated protein 12